MDNSEPKKAPQYKLPKDGSGDNTVVKANGFPKNAFSGDTAAFTSGSNNDPYKHVKGQLDKPKKA